MKSIGKTEELAWGGTRTIYNLRKDGDYTMKARMKNSGGETEWSKPLHVVIDNTPPTGVKLTSSMVALATPQDTETINLHAEAYDDQSRNIFVYILP